MKTDIEEDNFTLSSKMNKRWRNAPRPEVERFSKDPKKFPKPAEKLTLANPPTQNVRQKAMQRLLHKP